MSTPKHEVTGIILDVARWSGRWHIDGGWFCEQCNRECGERRDDLCPCCALGVEEELRARSGVVS